MSMTRKQAIKLMKEERALKKELGAEIATFLVDLDIDTSPDLEDALRKAYAEGNKGYSYMRNKELMEHFTKKYDLLHKQDEEVRFYSTNNRSWKDRNNHWGSSRTALNDEESLDLRREYAMMAEGLMTKIFEQAVLM